MKIAIVGGASAYTAGLLEAFVARASDFAGATLCLMDIDAEHLSIMTRLGLRMIEASGIDLSIEATTNQEKALRGADFVVTQLRVGGLQSRRLDERLPLKYGIVGQETVGPGGMFMALRTIPVMVALGNQMERLAPAAILLNYTNPTSMVTDAVRRRAGVRIIGLCDQARGDARRLAQWLSLDPSQVTLWPMGINHATWSSRLLFGEENILPSVRAKLMKLSEDSIPERKYRYMLRLFKLYDMIPSPYLRFYYFHDEMVKEARAARLTRAEEIMATLPRIWQHYVEQSARPQPVLTQKRGSLAHSELAVDVMASIIKRRMEVHIVNVPNQGAIADFRPESIVEVPAIIGPDGAQPLAMGALPTEVSGLIQALKEHEELVVDVALSGSRKGALKALLAHPLIHSLSSAESLLDEMLAANKGYLTYFSEG